MATAMDFIALALARRGSAGVRQQISSLEQKDELLETRIDQIVAPTGEAPSAAEVTDARIGADATVYASLGDAVRGQVGSLSSQISIATSKIYDGTTMISWEQGAFNRSTGATLSTDNVIRTKTYLSERYAKATCDPAYKMSVWVWNKSSDSLVGHIQADGTIGTGNTYKFFTEFTFNHSLYRYKLCAYNQDNTTAILPEAGVNVKMLIDVFRQAVDSNEIPAAVLQWSQGTIKRQTGEPMETTKAIRTAGYLPEEITHIKCDDGYKFVIFAWDKSSGTFAGHLQSNGLYGTADAYEMRQSWYVDRTENYKYKIVLQNIDVGTDILPTAAANCVTYTNAPSIQERNLAQTAESPSFSGDPVTIFENDGGDAIAGVDDGLLNFLSVIKISDSMYYMYYEAYGLGDAVGYNTAKLCFAYSTDGKNFTKGFPSGVTAPTPGSNVLLPAGSTHAHCVARVPDEEYPYRMVSTKGTHSDRIAQLWRSADGVNWSLLRTITNGYNDTQSSIIVRGNLLKIFLRTRNADGRDIGIITTDLDGNRMFSRWTSVISNGDSSEVFYTSAASALDDRRELLLPTIYRPADSTESVGCLLVDGGVCHSREIDDTAVMPSDVKSIYFAPGLVDIGLKTYAYYVTRDADHEHFVLGTTRSAIRCIEVTDNTFADVVRP